MKILLTLTVVLLGCATTTSHYGQLVDRCKATWGKDSLEFDECLHAARVSVGSPGLQSVIDRKNARIKKELEKYMAHLDREVGAKRMKRSEAMMAYNKMFKEKVGDVPWVSEHMAYVALLEERVEAGDLSRAEADYKAAKSASAVNSAVNRELLDRQQAEEQASVNNRNLQLQAEAQRQQGVWNALYLLFSIQPKAYHIYHHGNVWVH